MVLFFIVKSIINQAQVSPSFIHSLSSCCSHHCSSECHFDWEYSCYLNIYHIFCDIGFVASVTILILPPCIHIVTVMLITMMLICVV